MSSPALPPLPHIPISELVLAPLPQRRIFTEEDMPVFLRSKAYARYTLFVRTLNEAVVDTPLPDKVIEEGVSEPIRKLLAMLDELDRWTTDIPPKPTPQRFGNLAFRDWGARLEERAPTLLSTLLPKSLRPAIPHLTPYLLASFGSFVRIDYGSGHEVSFLLFLLGLHELGFTQQAAEEERALVLRVLARYLDVCFRLESTYKLEPAGSHGVWGLDDYCFVPYIFGSAQVRSSQSPPHLSLADPPVPSPTINLYTQNISRIAQFKRGPWHEHSPQLHSIATTVARWAKVNSGMLKMYDAEVLRKRVVMQHVVFGGLLPWEAEEGMGVAKEGKEGRMLEEAPGGGAAVGTRAPWADGAGSAPLAVAAVPWASSASAHTASLPTLLPRGERRQQRTAAAGGRDGFAIPSLPARQGNSLRATGSAAAMSSPFGVLSRPSPAVGLPRPQRDPERERESERRDG